MQREPAAAPQGEAGGDAAEGGDEGEEEGVLLRVEHRGGEHGGREFLELAEVLALAHEGLGGAHALDGLVVAGGDLGVVFPDVAGAHEHPLLEELGDDGQRRDDGEDDEAEAPVHDEEAGGDHDHEAQAPDDVEEAPRDDAGEAVAVGGEPADEPAYRPRVEEGELQLLEALEAVAADVVGEAVGEVAGHLDEHPDAGADRERDGEIDGDVVRERCGGAVAHHAVDHPAGDESVGGVAHRDRDGGDGERDQVELQAERAAEDLPPQPGVELGLEFVFLVKLGGHGGGEVSFSALPGARFPHWTGSARGGGRGRAGWRVRRGCRSG